MSPDDYVWLCIQTYQGTHTLLKPHEITTCLLSNYNFSQKDQSIKAVIISSCTPDLPQTQFWHQQSFLAKQLLVFQLLKVSRRWKLWPERNIACVLQLLIVETQRNCAYVFSLVPQARGKNMVNIHILATPLKHKKPYCVVIYTHNISWRTGIIETEVRSDG